MPSLDAGDLHIHYALSGCEEGDLILLSNSLGSSLRMWDKVLPALEATIYCGVPAANAAFHIAREILSPAEEGT
jgi:hypothetical protein